MRSIWNALRHRYSPDPWKDRVVLLNEAVRTKMVEEIEEEMKNAMETTSSSVEEGPVPWEDILHEANEALVECYAKLQSLEEMENFIGIRLRSYRQQLVESHEETTGEQEASINEDTQRKEISLPESESSRNSFEKDDVYDKPKPSVTLQILQDDLKKVEHTHGILEQSILQMKEQILLLEHKVQETKERQRECIEFVKVVKDLQIPSEEEQNEVDNTNYLQYYPAPAFACDPPSLTTVDNTCPIATEPSRDSLV